MTVDWFDLAAALRWLVLFAGLGWMVYAWWQRIEYRRAVLGLVALAAVDFLAQAWAGFASRPDSELPADFSVYSVLILLAGLLGLAVTLWSARRRGLALAPVLDAALVVVLFGGLGARAYHVLTHWDYYAQNSDQLWNLAQGGMGLRGGLLLGLCALALYARLRRMSFWALGDAGALGLALAESIGWFGAGLVGANYGIVSDVSFARDLPDVYGIIEPRIPVQLIGSALFFVLFIGLARWGRSRRAQPGALLLAFLALASLGNLALDFARGDETLIWNGWRIDVWVDLSSAAIALPALVYKTKLYALRLKRSAG